jgi:pSer/pThr/pTyr-binding forkhead associated (FHA) protein
LSEYALPDYLVAEKYPYTISPEHCENERTAAGISVRDLNSRLGTVVKGTRISSQEGYQSEIDLGLGEQSLVLGF